MRAYSIQAGEGLAKLQFGETEQPTISSKQVLVRWRATSLNFHDYLVANGSIPVAEGQIPMSDGAGEVVEVGSDVTQWKVGDRVMSLFFPNWQDGQANLQKTRLISGETVAGYACEYSAMAESALTSMPNNYSYEEAATLPCAALTAWRGLVVEGKIKAGDKVLVEGSGGVSIFALQLAKSIGAQVFATTSSEEKSKLLKGLGADHVVNYREDEKWGKTIFKLSGGGVDHVLDVGGNTTLAQSVEAVGFGGHISLLGILGGRSGSFVLPKLFFKHAHMHGIAVASRAHQQAMVKALDQADFKPVVDKVFAFDQLKEAFEYQEAGKHFGKIVVQMSV